MRDNSAVMLLGFLYDQLEELRAVDRSDEQAVDAACRLNKAVNDTSRSILAVADLSVRAMGAQPTLGRRNLLSGFFEDGGDAS